MQFLVGNGKLITLHLKLIKLEQQYFLIIGLTEQFKIRKNDKWDLDDEKTGRNVCDMYIFYQYLGAVKELEGVFTRALR